MITYWEYVWKFNVYATASGKVSHSNFPSVSQIKSKYNYNRDIEVKYAPKPF